MANTYSQLNIHCVFAVKGRENLITSNFRDDLHRYMSGILKNDDSFPLAVNGWKDHVHVFFELPVTMSVKFFRKFTIKNISLKMLTNKSINKLKSHKNSIIVKSFFLF